MVKKKLQGKPLSSLCMTGEHDATNPTGRCPRMTTITNSYDIGPFSASSVPGHAVLMLRIVWPKKQGIDAALDAVVQACTSKPNYARAARYVMARGLRRLVERFTLFTETLRTPSGFETPRRPEGSMMDNLAGFHSLVSLHNLLAQQKVYQSSREPGDSPVRSPQAPQPQKYRDVGQTSHPSFLGTDD